MNFDKSGLLVIQPLPLQVRRKLIEQLADFSPPGDFRDDEIFYGWLLEHYEQHGFGPVDAALIAQGGKNPRRTCLNSFRIWVADHSCRPRSDLIETDIHQWADALATLPLDLQDLAGAALVWFDTIISPSNEDMAEDEVSETRTSPIERLQALLAEARELHLAEAMEGRLHQMADAIAAELAERRAETERLSDAARQEAAMRQWQDAVSALPENLRQQLQLPHEPLGDPEEIAFAASTLAELSAANAAARAARQAFAQHDGAIEEEDALRAAMERAETDRRNALDEARGACEALGGLADGPCEDLPEEVVATPTQPSAASEECPDVELVAETVDADEEVAESVHDEKEEEGEDLQTGSELIAVLPEEATVVDARRGDDAVADGTQEVAPEAGRVSPDYPEPTVVELAPQSVPDLAITPWDDWVRLAVHQERLALAIHVSRARSLAGADEIHSWPAIVLEGALFGRGIIAANDRSATHYGIIADGLMRHVAGLDMSRASDFGQVLAVMAGAVSASLVPGYAGVGVIQALPTGTQLAGFHELMGFLRDGPTLGLAALDDLSIGLADSLRDQQSQAVDSLKDWYHGASNRSISYQPAQALWAMNLIRPHGEIGSVIEAILGQSDKARLMAEALCADLSDDVEAFLDTRFEASSPKSRHIEGVARVRLLTLLQEARDHLATWLRISRPARTGSDRFEGIRNRLRAITGQANQVIADLIVNGAPDVQCGANLLRVAIERLENAAGGSPARAADPQELLDVEIALLPDFPLNGRIGLEIAVEDVVPMRKACVANLKAGVLDWSQAFDRALEIGAPGTASRILPLLSANGDEAALQIQVDAVATEQRRLLAARRAALRSQLDDLQSASFQESGTIELESLLVELERFELQRLPVEDGVDARGIGDFPILKQRLDDFTERLDLARARVAGDLQASIEQEEAKGEALDDCRAMLARGDLGTLAEELSQIRQFGSERRSVNPDHLLTDVRDFAANVRAVPVDQAPPTIQALRDAALAGRAVGSLPFDRLREGDRAKARELLDAWAGLKRAFNAGQAQPQAEALIRFFSLLGFTDVKADSGKPWREGRTYVMRTDTLRSATDCIIPAFGSEANGTYTVVVMRQGVLEKSMASGFGEWQPPALVLALEWLSPKARREFLRKARGSAASAFALIDEAAAASLAATPGRSLRSFFNLAVPFGAARPYADTSGETSVEMFFGREREFATLIDPQGSCLVFGGRQLGKTALLKQIELRSRSNPLNAVAYKDIKNTGSSEQADQVWNRIAEAICPRIDVNPDNCRGDRVIATMRTWLEAQPQRRILILLDEADNFLEWEMEHEFPNIMKMKGLMEDTGRRVKFVFAGLHNVQRFVRTPNNPILHFGEPVNIGPLLGHDRDAARRMVFEPMAAVGIGFDQPTDAYHMLSLVGYYPSLLQTFAKSTLAGVDSQLARRGEPAQMPFNLDRDTIEKSFADSDFRNQLRSKFRATLGLDPRYECIAYAVCYKAEEERERGLLAGHGYAIREIFELARTYWPQGFADIRSSETFGALLDEMVGLGVLAKNGESYVIRSARIAAMLGNREQIENHLLEFADRQPPQKADPLANHRILTNGRHSPLSLRQETALVESLRSERIPVAVPYIFGSRAAFNAEAMVEAIEGLAQALDFPPPRVLDFRHMDGLRTVVQVVRREGTPGHPKLIVCKGRWPDGAELAELDTMRELRDQANPVRLVFIGSGEVPSVPPEVPGQGRFLRASLIEVTPWDFEAVLLWLRRNGSAMAMTGNEEAEMARRVLAASGGFPLVFDMATLPRSSDVTGEDLLASLSATARKVLDPRSIGLTDNGLADLAGQVVLFEEGDGLTGDDLDDLASTAGLPGWHRMVEMGLLNLHQGGREGRWKLNPVLAGLLADSRR